jgi:hypothetical protein
MALVGSCLQRQKKLGTLYQTLGIGLIARNLLQEGRCRAACYTLGKTAGDGATVVVIRASLRKNLTVFGSYDTIPMSV